MRDHPDSSAARFVLAYHYMVLDHPDEAVRQLQEVVRLSPDDQLSKQLIRAFTKPASAKPAPG